ncbi:class I SAM-dependent methyltransferase [Rhodococcus sp. D2-41]|uniref:class I SAM-dependent methyltransferase n=1 Tax=Speluncibacter jeojiensis TaxID=2710754 RepID=UPI00240F9DFE|nr:class I SAM-dependent methyltransferase [Rhodococcus sp. D2-41]MDG3010246.1 class I SAM-dependent methyltransferase [Rhodococcus sp. D2-41]
MDASAWDERYRQSDLVWGAPPNPVVVEYVTSLPHGSAVDVGCGEGRNAIWLATRGWETTGIDFSQVALDKAAQIVADHPRPVRERLHWVCDDLLAADLGTGRDLILIVFIHLPAEQRRTLLDRAVAALRPGGTLLMLGHHSRNLHEGVGGPPDAQILFTPQDVVADLGGADDSVAMEIVVAKDHLRETEAGTAIDALVVARRR